MASESCSEHCLRAATFEKLEDDREAGSYACMQVVEINDSVSLLTRKLEEAEEARRLLLQARKNLRWTGW